MSNYLALGHGPQQGQQRVPEGGSVVLQQLWLMPNAMPNTMPGAMSLQVPNRNFCNEQVLSLGLGKNETSPLRVVNQPIVGDDPNANLTCHVGNQGFLVNKENANPSCYSRGDHMINSNVSAVHQPQNNMVTAVRADHMTVEQTATWMRTFASYNGWQEAEWYAWNFKENNIWGYLLPKLTLDSLKRDLGIQKYGHRLEIMAAIKCLFPGMSIRDGPVEKMTETDHLSSPMSVSVPEAKSEGMDASPKHTHQSAHTCQKPKSPWLSAQIGVSPKESKACHSTSPKTHEQIKEVIKWFSQRTGKRPSPIKKNSVFITEKSSRASPDNPLRYVALRKVKIRSGKSIHSDPICNIEKGTVIVINQIKGRSGRVVLPQENGTFEKVGWATLHTHDKQQLLQKHSYQKTAVMFERKMM